MSDINEQSIVECLTGAANYLADNGRAHIVIERAGFSFYVQGVNEDQTAKCRRLATKNRGRRDEEVDWSRYAAQLIYEATVPDDKKRLWDNKAVWDKLNCVTGSDVIFKCLTPAERAKIVTAIENLSGYDDTDLDGIIKN